MPNVRIAVTETQVIQSVAVQSITVTASTDTAKTVLQATGNNVAVQVVRSLPVIIKPILASL